MLYVERAITRAGTETIRLEAKNGDCVYLKKEEVSDLLRKLFDLGEFGPSPVGIQQDILAYQKSKVCRLMGKLPIDGAVYIKTESGALITRMFRDGAIKTEEPPALSCTRHLSDVFLTLNDLVSLEKHLTKWLK